MTNGKYAVVHAAELLTLPAAPRAEVKRELLGEFLQNPFLDDDLQALALRSGVSRAEAAEALAGLCREGLLKEAGGRGYRLDLEQLETAPSAATPAISPEGLVALLPEEVETLQAEAARIHAHVQEELFARLRGEMAEPMLLIQQFLDAPNSKGLGQARVALEQVNAFLKEFMLNGNPGAESAGDSEKR